ncbi:hypothetical protein HYQ46_007448 [Verticillium longisporum]|nr:hypothetical protein HYQ46_007448 [Verticillium longisporum]
MVCTGASGRRGLLLLLRGGCHVPGRGLEERHGVGGTARGSKVEAVVRRGVLVGPIGRIIQELIVGIGLVAGRDVGLGGVGLHTLSGIVVDEGRLRTEMHKWRRTRRAAPNLDVGYSRIHRATLFQPTFMPCASCKADQNIDSYVK